MKPVPAGVENLGVLILRGRYGLELAGKKETCSLVQDGIGIDATDPSASFMLNACIFLRNIKTPSE